MSSTTGIQNLLVNVFRPVYRYEIPVGGSNTIYVPKLEMSNIDTYSGNAMAVFTAAVGDANFNVYVGSNAGNTFSNLKNCSNVTAVGYGAGSGVSNVQNSTYLGYNAGEGAATASAVIGIGANAGGNGASNIFIGNATAGTGSNNIALGHGISLGTSNWQFRLGAWGTLSADLSKNWVGVGTTTQSTSNVKLDVSGDAKVQGQFGVNIEPGNRTVDINGDFRARDSSMNALDFNNGVTLSTGGLGSLRGTLTVSGGVSTIGTLKRGVVLVSAIDADDPANYASRLLFAYSSGASTDLGTNISNGNATITTSTSNIQITDATNARYNWAITYFPLP